MQGSHINQQDQLYVRYDQEGNTAVVKESEIQMVKGYSYRKVHYTQEDKRNILARMSKQVFNDPQWKVTEEDVRSIDIQRGPCVLKRIIKLYPKNKRPLFFPPQTSTLTNINNPSELPPFISQLNLFPMKHYKSLFLTQDFQNQGLYHVLINVQGRWETDVVDDFIPVYAKDEEPVWGMDLSKPWQLILLKVWAKRLGGYRNVLRSAPWSFIQCFTNSNWKYFNLARQPYEFLAKYTDKAKYGKFILKTKSFVKDEGLVSNCCGYQIISLIDSTPTKKDIKQKKWIITIRSTVKNKWAGNMSVIDQNLNSIYEKNKLTLRLQRDFVMDHNDFLNLFSTVHIGSIRQQRDIFTNYYRLTIPPNQNRAVYLIFDIVKPQGFLDFTIVQFDSNKKKSQNQKSRLDIAAHKKETGEIKTLTNIKVLERYLKVKYSLVLDQSNVRNYSYPTEEDKKYSIPKYKVYEIQYAKGYNRGDAHFVNLVQGRYILKIKKERDTKQADFVVNYSSNFNFSMRQVTIKKQQTALICKQSMVSLINQQPRVCLDKQLKNQQIAFANLFEAIGYGFIGIRSSMKNTYNILVEIDPKKLREEGYQLKNNFKNLTQVFGVIVSPGESTSIVFKKVDEYSTTMVWPPKSIGIFKENKKSFK